jgi:hypothetical protein
MSTATSDIIEIMSSKSKNSAKSIQDPVQVPVQVQEPISGKDLETIKELINETCLNIQIIASFCSVITCVIVIITLLFVPSIFIFLMFIMFILSSTIFAYIVFEPLKNIDKSCKCSNKVHDKVQVQDQNNLSKILREIGIEPLELDQISKNLD